MVILRVKKGDDDLYLFESKLSDSVKVVTEQLVEIYNGCRKICRICSEIETLKEYGVFKSANQQSPVEDQIEDLKITEDSIEAQYEPKGGSEENKDPTETRIGRRPKEEMRNILDKVVAEAKGNISVELIKSNICLTYQHIVDALSILQGGVDVVYPDGLPPHDPIVREFQNREKLSGTDEEKKIFDPFSTVLWFAGKKLDSEKKLSDFFGKNEKTKVVVKLSKRGSGPPTREPVMSEEQQKKIMISEFRRREELKKLEEEESNIYLNSDWADNLHLKKSFHGVQNISWKPH